MGLLSLFKRNDTPPAELPPTPDTVAQARSQARRRLIGATVLLAVGVIGFPLLFETQPRPVRMDIPIEIPRKDNAPPLAMPPAAAPRAEAQADKPAAPAPNATASAAPAAHGAIVTERAGEQGRELPAAPEKSVAAVSASAAKAAPAAAGPATPASAAAHQAQSRDDGARALAILEGQPVPAAATSPAAVRIVVQVGAFTDADRMREVRTKVERLGLKTYIQVVQVDGVKHTRVRVGPFSTKAEADKAAAKIKGAGLPTAMLTL